MNGLYDHPLLNLPKFGAGIGLHRVQYLMAQMGLDARDVADRAIVVTGSNGKGSTAKICSELLRIGGGEVGLFTSPHLYQYNERFQIDGVPISTGALIAILDELKSAVDGYRRRFGDAVGAFEAQFVAALCYFRSLNVRWMVLEAGIGGRYDPVRLARAPVVGLVSLDYEHTELLGRTLAEIAFDKLDAAPPGGAVVAGVTCGPLERQITTVADLKSVSVDFVTPDAWQDRGLEDDRQRFEIHDDGLVLRDLSSKLAGEHQLNNHAVAAKLCRARLQRSGLWPMADVEAVWRQAIARVAWPGRLERIQDDPPIHVDVGHTPAGVQAALTAYRALAPAPGSILVTGGSKNKDVGEMLAILAPAFDRIICTSAAHNGLGADAVEALARAANGSATIVVCPSIREAVDRAASEAARLSFGVYVAGGLFLAAEFMEAWRGGAPEKMRFF